jgi:single-strand DNA-binding protein
MLKASLIGNLGGDPESRTSPDGRAFLRMNVACNYRARNQGGEWEDWTEWVWVTVFGRQAERLGEYLRKGSRVYVDGGLEARPWTDREHQARAGLEVIATDVQFAGLRVDEERTSGESKLRGGGPAGPAPSGGGRAPTPPSEEDGVEDLPF